MEGPETAGGRRKEHRNPQPVSPSGRMGQSHSLAAAAAGGPLASYARHTHVVVVHSHLGHLVGRIPPFLGRGHIHL